ncbi:MAG: phosphoglycolate phosphatase [Cupriavidus sp.]|nr:MAG: phosphoglycolate phosphatase [Cupriavidus sp.]
MSRFPLKCVLFDLDGTLVDTAPDLGAAANAVRIQLGMAPLPLPAYRPVASAGARGLLKVALGITPDHPDFPARRDDFLEYYRANLSKLSVLFDGMAELLAAFERNGILWGVVTNKPARLTNPLLEELNLASRAACAVSGDEVPKAKPAPDSILLACKRIGLDVADCVYVGDDKRDIDAAKAAGMRSIAADWGYLGDNGSIESWSADLIARSPAELARLLDMAL